MNRTNKEQKLIKEAIAAAIEADPEQTIEELGEVVAAELGFRPARATIHRVLGELGKSAKRLTRWEDVNG
jgi:hypothetical protein